MQSFTAEDLRRMAENTDQITGMMKVTDPDLLEASAGRRGSWRRRRWMTDSMTGHGGR